MNELPADIAAELVKLRAAYLERLPQEIAELACLAGGAVDQAELRPALEILHLRLHKLAGSGGTFGFGDLSRQAHELEETVEGWLAADPASVNIAQRRALAHAVAALATTLGH